MPSAWAAGARSKSETAADAPVWVEEYLKKGLDPDALRRCQAGDAAALGMLYDCYRQRVYYLG